MSVDTAFTETRLRVRYAETDQMGYAYYGVYAAWLEVGRVEHLRARGLSYREIEAAGMFLPVRELHLDYLAPARYDDELAVRTRAVELGKSRVVFESEIRTVAGAGSADDGRLLARGRVTLACVDRAGRPRRLTEEVRLACAAS